MKIIHFSDTHVGYSAYNRLDESGYNQRESDFYNAFKQVIDFVIAKKPDLVIHSGDVFDSVRPTNRAISFVLEQIVRVSKAGIPIVLIAGNHETPRLRETGSVFRVFEHLDGVFPVFKGRLETFKFGELMVHALPHCVDKEVFNSELAKMRPDSKFRYNVAMLHAGVVGLSVFKMGEFNEQLAQTGNLHKDFDYVALGHYHKHCEIADNAVYAGSTERAGFGEIGESKGFVVVDLAEGTREFKELDIREMLDIGPIDCSRKAFDEIDAAIRKRVEMQNVSGKVVRITLKNIRPKDHQNLDMASLKKLLRTALHFQIKAETLNDEQVVASGDMMFDTLEKEWIHFLEQKAIDGVDKEKLAELGMTYLKNGGRVE